MKHKLIEFYKNFIYSNHLLRVVDVHVNIIIFVLVLAVSSLIILIWEKGVEM